MERTKICKLRNGSTGRVRTRALSITSLPLSYRAPQNVNSRSLSCIILTSVRNDLLVWFDDLHVNAVTLVAELHGLPTMLIVVFFLCSVFWDRFNGTARGIGCQRKVSLLKMSSRTQQPISLGQILLWYTSNTSHTDK